MTWINTFSGAFVDFARPAEIEVNIEDIAHSLSLQSRFVGHTTKFYSVAQHSCHVAEIVGRTHPRLAIDALLHDAHEAYIGDVSRPMKQFLGRVWEALETDFQRSVLTHFGLQYPSPEIVKRVDGLILVNEALALNPAWEWAQQRPKVEGFDRIEPWSADFAEQEFLLLYRKFTKHLSGPRDFTWASSEYPPPAF